MAAPVLADVISNADDVRSQDSNDFVSCRRNIGPLLDCSRYEHLSYQFSRDQRIFDAAGAGAPAGKKATFSPEFARSAAVRNTSLAIRVNLS